MKPYPEQDSKKEQVARMFDGIARRYDMLDHLLSLGIDRSWRRKAVGKIKELEPYSILDVATGTGDLAIEMARRIPGADITGADISREMLRVGRRKAVKRNVWNRISFVYGDAEALPFGEGAFDVVTAAFGVRNFQDADAGLREMYRVLKPGGAVFVLEFSVPQGKIFGPLYRFYFKSILPRIGGLFSRDYDAYKYLPSSVGEFPPPQVFIARLEEAGFGRCALRKLTRGVAIIYKGEKI